jgi:hypothetical protein
VDKFMVHGKKERKKERRRRTIYLFVGKKGKITRWEWRGIRKTNFVHAS